MRTQVHTARTIAYFVVREVAVLGAAQHQRPTAGPIPVCPHCCGRILPLEGKVVNAVIGIEASGVHHNRDRGGATAPRLRSSSGFELKI